MPCSNCNGNLPIVNKKYNLCPNCNSLRLTGKSLQDRQAQSVIKYQNKTKDKERSFGPATITSPPTHSKIRQQTKKEAGVKYSLSALKQHIRLEAIQNNEYFCKGCGVAGGMDCSHILSVGQYKALELVEENIQLMCRDCHRTWEMAPIEQQMELNCFVDNLHFIYSQDKKAYQKFITRIEECKEWLLPGIDNNRIEFINTTLNKLADIINNN